MVGWCSGGGWFPWGGKGGRGEVGFVSEGNGTNCRGRGGEGHGMGFDDFPKIINHPSTSIIIYMLEMFSYLFYYF